MKRVAALFALAAATMLARCEPPTFPANRPFERDQKALITAEDLTVLETVVSAHARGELLDSPPPPPAPPSNEETRSSRAIESRPRRSVVVIAPFTGTSDPNVAVSIGLNAGGWRSVDSEDRVAVGIPHSALRDFEARNRRSVSLESFQPHSVRVTRSTDAFQQPVFILTLPGYSLDGNVAVLEVSATYEGYGAGQLVYLRRTGDSWTVIAKRLTWIS